MTPREVVGYVCAGVWGLLILALLGLCSVRAFRMALSSDEDERFEGRLVLGGVFFVVTSLGILCGLS